MRHKCAWVPVLIVAAFAAPLFGQTPAASDSELVRQLMKRIDALEAEVKSIKTSSASASALPSAPMPAPATVPEIPAAAPAPVTPQQFVPAPAPVQETPAVTQADPHDHMISMGAGMPKLNIRGFFDFNFGLGSLANTLIYPINGNGCNVCGNPSTPEHNAFEAGEFDLFMTSKLSEHLRFVAEVVFGADATNEIGIDIERYQLTYTHNKYFAASAGRFHTTIGYYNNAYHHGNWFSTAEGRPIMYLFEDSGGILPVHTVGVQATGLVPHTDKINLRWTAEIGNGRSSTPSGEPVQNFYSDRNYKATNFALSVRPEAIPGVQIGASIYHDKLAPDGLPRVNQNIESAYAVYFNGPWEFMNEAVLLTNTFATTGKVFHSPMAYTQIAHKFGIYRPYFRYQYFNSNRNDPVNAVVGLDYGPSVGIRADFTDYVAFKLQYNHLFQSSLPAGNGLTAQLAFTF
jgi:hypothetical protein